MDRDEFRDAIAADPNLSRPIERAAQAARPEQYSVVVEAAVVGLMFPVVRYVLIEIGLPWFYELKRYSELQRQRLHQWIDDQSRKKGLDPDATEAASEALCAELEQTVDQAARTSWEHLAALLKKGPDDVTD